MIASAPITHRTGVRLQLAAALCAATAAIAAIACTGDAEPGAAEPGAAEPYEVWVLDQSDSPGAAFGGTVYVYTDAQLRDTANTAASPRLRIDLAGAAAELCRQRTGAPPVRPHMVRMNDDRTHAIIAFVASGHVLFLDAGTGGPVECLRASRSATGQQAHAAYPTPDGRYVLVANQNGKRLERIAVDYSAGTFSYDTAAMLDLAVCTTPAGAPCEAAATRPDNAPVCPYMSEGGLAFVTLRGGGLLVVDVRDTPMRIVAGYDSAHVRGNGCGGVEVAGHMYVNAGGRPGVHEHMQLYGFDVYRFALDGFDDRGGPLPANSPPRTVLWSVDGAHDSHGMVATPDGRYIWVFDRHGDAAEIFETANGRNVRSVSLNGSLTDNAAPDIAAIAPAGDRIFVALRGASPLSGDPHNATGSTPGLGIIELQDGGSNGRLARIIRISNSDGGGDRADPHAVVVRTLR